MLIEKGFARKNIAKTMCCSQSTIAYWIKKYKLRNKLLYCKCCGKILTGKHRSTCSKSCKYKIFSKVTLTPPNIDWRAAQAYYDSGKSGREVCDKYKIYWWGLSTAKAQGLFISRTASETKKMRGTFSHPQSKETRQKLSKYRKKFYQEHPEKHNWKFSKKLVSPPCEKLKKRFEDEKIQFVPEFTPLSDRFFSIDIAIPEKMMAIEVNGNQHYEKNKSLKPYYQARHDLITDAGWTVIEMHYSLCYNDVYIKNLINLVKNAPLANFTGK